MKFMKLGSKPDTLQANGKSIRYMAAEMSTDIIINVADVKFYLHKFPLLSKSSHLQKVVANTSEENSEVYINDIPGGPASFELCAKFCYGISVTLNAYNVVAARCAAEYLGMHEAVEKGNLIYKIDVFLNSSIFRSWKDSIIALQTTKSMLPWSEELKLVSHCIDSIASKASVDTSMVDWSYAYNRKKLPEENGNDPTWNGIRNHKAVPKDWWVEDLCGLEVDLYKRVINGIKSKTVSSEVIGEALKAYAYCKLLAPTKGQIPVSDMAEYQSTLDAILWLLPTEKGSVSCSFLLKLLKAGIFVDSCETARRELIKKIGQQLEEASVNDLLIQSAEGESMKYDVDTVEKIVHEFLTQDQNPEIESLGVDKAHDIGPGILSEASKLMVVKLIDAYLAEIAMDPNLLVPKFVELAEMVSSISRPAHDGLYRAIDTYLKEHPEISKSERKKICRLMDCKKLSADACMHAVQNERLPMRVIVQVLYFEQVRAAVTSGTSTPDLPKSIRELNNGSSKSTTANADEYWDAMATAEELKALKSELAALRLGSARDRDSGDSKSGANKAALGRMKGLIMSTKIFAKLWSSKSGHGETTGSDSSESPNSANPEDKSPPSRNRSSNS
ncbi:hypothetical protein Ancab_017630 [Ancistrocladus abbreviatus]